jgi:NADH-quinone oxidoreductase subunit A
MAVGSSPYLPVLIALVIFLPVMLVVSGLALLLGPKKPSAAKLDTYECGIPVAPSSARQRFSAKFALVALLFILFDIETVFLFLWAILFKQLGWFGLVEVGLFLITLLVGFVYVLRRRALVW